jgi:hypothetical protein
MTTALPNVANSAAFDLASIAIERAHQHAADSGWAVDNDQVGFDFAKWLDNTRRVEFISGGAWGIFNIEAMGTAEDYERISQAPKQGLPKDEVLWHMGMRMNDSFRRLVMERPSNRSSLAQARQAIWGDKTPQWWLLNYGNRFAGALNPKDGSYSIETGGWEVAVDMQEIVARSVNAYLRREGLLV